MTDDFRGLLEEQGRTFHAVQNGIERLNDRCDSIETALGRSLRGTADGESNEEKRQAETFASLINGKSAFSREQVGDPDLDAYRQYRGVLSKYLRYGLTHLTPEENQALVMGRVSAKALSVGIEADGGYWVTPQISDRVVRRQFDTSPMRTIANLVTIGTDAIEFPTDSNDLISGGWVGETDTRGETATPEVGIKRIPVHEQFANPRATQKVLDDAAFPVEQWLADRIADKFIREENAAFVSGESLSDILQGLERDILRILTRLLVTEPLARGLTAGLGSFTGGGLGSRGAASRARSAAPSGRWRTCSRARCRGSASAASMPSTRWPPRTWRTRSWRGSFRRAGPCTGRAGRRATASRPSSPTASSW
jgi:Phage capsid family